jgi:hypothetical protein
VPVVEPVVVEPVDAPVPELDDVEAAPPAAELDEVSSSLHATSADPANARSARQEP